LLERIARVVRSTVDEVMVRVDEKGGIGIDSMDQLHVCFVQVRLIAGGAALNELHCPQATSFGISLALLEARLKALNGFAKAQVASGKGLTATAAKWATGHTGSASSSSNASVSSKEEASTKSALPKASSENLGPKRKT